MSETNRVTDEGSYNDGSYGFERLLTTACGRAFLSGGALIEHVCHFDRSVSEVEKSPAIETKPSVYGHPKHLPAGAPRHTTGTVQHARAGSAPYNRNGTTRARGGSPHRKTKRLPFAAEVCRF